MILTREERERFVLDLYNQGKNTREIAEEARMSFRDIGAILDKAEEEKETNKEQAEKMSQSTQAYKLYSEGKSPIQVAVALNLQEPEVARFYVEYWKQRQLYSLNKSHVTVEFFSFFLTNSNLIISQSISIKEIGFCFHSSRCS